MMLNYKSTTKRKIIPNFKKTTIRVATYNFVHIKMSSTIRTHLYFRIGATWRGLFYSEDEHWLLARDFGAKVVLYNPFTIYHSFLGKFSARKLVKDCIMSATTVPIIIVSFQGTIKQIILTGRVTFV